MFAAIRRASSWLSSLADERRLVHTNTPRIIADDRESLAIRLERNKDRSLQAVGVLVFIDQHVIKPRANVACDLTHLHHLRPVKEQIVVIEYILPLLGLNIGAE